MVGPAGNLAAVPDERAADPKRGDRLADQLRTASHHSGPGKVSAACGPHAEWPKRSVEAPVADPYTSK
jgi:hypothetical protein